MKGWTHRVAPYPARGGASYRVVLMFILLRPESGRTATLDALELSGFMFCFLDVSSICKRQEIPHGHS